MYVMTLIQNDFKWLIFCFDLIFIHTANTKKKSQASENDQFD